MIFKNFLSGLKIQKLMYSSWWQGFIKNLLSDLWGNFSDSLKIYP